MDDRLFVSSTSRVAVFDDAPSTDAILFMTIVYNRHSVGEDIVVHLLGSEPISNNPPAVFSRCGVSSHWIIQKLVNILDKNTYIFAR